MSLSHTFRKDTGVLAVEQEVDARQLRVLVFGADVPVAGVALALLVVAVNQHRAPTAGTVFELAETLAGHWVEFTLRVVAEGDPLLRQTAVVLRVVERLQRKPVGRGRSRVFIVDVL